MTPQHQCGAESCDVKSVGVCPVFTEINDSLKRIEDKIDVRLNDHDTRLRALENWRSLLVGAWLVISALGWAAWDYLKGKQ